MSAEHGVLATVVATTATCPVAIRAEVSRLATRIERTSPSSAIRQFAVEVDDPSGDLIASVLVLAMSHSGKTSELLSELASTIRERAAMRLRVEAERSGQRAEARFVIGFSLVVMIAIALFGRDSQFLDAYDSAIGQLVLLLIATAFGVGMLWLSRLTRFERPARFLSIGGDR
jgi:Flp pilus assembly protein TadB